MSQRISLFSHSHLIMFVTFKQTCVFYFTISHVLVNRLPNSVFMSRYMFMHFITHEQTPYNETSRGLYILIKIYLESYQVSRGLRDCQLSKSTQNLLRQRTHGLDNGVQPEMTSLYSTLIQVTKSDDGNSQRKILQK